MGKPLSSAHQIVCSCGFMSSDMCVYQRILFVPQRFCVCVCVFNFLSFHFAGPLSPHLTFYLSLSLYLHFCHFLSSLSQSHTPCVTHNVFFFILWFRPSCLTVFALYGLALFKYYFLSLNGTNIVCNYFRWTNRMWIIYQTYLVHTYLQFIGGSVFFFLLFTNGLNRLWLPSATNICYRMAIIVSERFCVTMNSISPVFKHFSPCWGPSFFLGPCSQ